MSCCVPTRIRRRPACKCVDFVALMRERLPKKYQDKNIEILYDRIHCPIRYGTLGEKRELCCGRMIARAQAIPRWIEHGTGAIMMAKLKSRYESRRVALDVRR
jgi:hypothetical protein